MNLFADVIGPGEIRDGGRGALVVGELDGRDSRRVREVVDDLQAWGPARATDNVSGYLWSKLGFGAMLVATALADAPMAELIDRHRAVMHALVAEIYAVAAAEGVTLEPFDAFDPLPYAGDDDVAKERATDALVAWLRTQAKDRSGIWRDIAVRRRPTEVPTHYRPVLAAAARHGIPVPGLERLVAQIGELESGAAWTRPASPPSPVRCDDRGAAAVRGRRRRRRRAAPVARRPASAARGRPRRLRRAGDAERRPRVAEEGARARRGVAGRAARRRPRAGRTTSPASTATSWCSSTPAPVTVR